VVQKVYIKKFASNFSLKLLVKLLKSTYFN
jgi:hypothetical protein